MKSWLNLFYTFILLLSINLLKINAYEIEEDDKIFENTEVLIKEANNTIVKCKDYLKWSEYINGSCSDYTSKYQCQTHEYIVDPITGVSANDACCVSTM